jgi:membrane protease YdiL (CAAX protease family)
MHESAPNQFSRRDAAAVVFAILLPTLVTWAYFFKAGTSSAMLQQVVYGLAKTFQFGFPIAWVLLVQRDWPRWKPLGAAGVGVGIAFGLAVCSAILVLYRLVLLPNEAFAGAFAEMQQKIAAFGFEDPRMFLGLGVFYSLGHSALEEYYWRWFVFGQLRKWIPLWAAIVISSLGFMAHHVLVIGSFFGFYAPVTWIFSFGVAVGGAFWAWLYQRSGSLVGPWLSHLLVDAAIFAVGYDLVRRMTV